VLLTQGRDANAITEALTEEGTQGVIVVPIRAPKLLRRFEGRLGLGHLDYVIWQWRAFRVARRLEPTVDVAHHLTFANDWLPCALLFLRRVPVVWGPVGGTARFPWRLARYISLRGFVRELARELVTRTLRQYTAVLVRRCGATVVGANGEVAARFQRHAAQVFVEPHVAMPAAPPASPMERHGGNGERRAIFAARLSSWKGPHLAIEALARADKAWHLDIFGAGEEEEEIRRRVRRLGLDDRVRMLGHRPIEELRAGLAQADVLLFPSMHDSSPYTVAEAVRLGCPVICLDVGGPPLLVANGGGVAVAPDADAPARIAEALLNVRRHPPNDRWNADRLTQAITQWYEAALARAPRSRELRR